MGVGNSKEIKLDETLEKLNSALEQKEINKEDIIYLYRDKNNKIKKELRFESKMNNPNFV